MKRQELSNDKLKLQGKASFQDFKISLSLLSYPIKGEWENVSKKAKTQMPVQNLNCRH